MDPRPTPTLPPRSRPRAALSFLVAVACLGGGPQAPGATHGPAPGRDAAATPTSVDASASARVPESALPLRCPPAAPLPRPRPVAGAPHPFLAVLRTQLRASPGLLGFQRAAIGAVDLGGTAGAEATRLHYALADEAVRVWLVGYVRHLGASFFADMARLRALGPVVDPTSAAAARATLGAFARELAAQGTRTAREAEALRAANDPPVERQVFDVVTSVRRSDELAAIARSQAALAERAGLAAAVLDAVPGGPQRLLAATRALVAALAPRRGEPESYEAHESLRALAALARPPAAPAPAAVPLPAEPAAVAQLVAMRSWWFARRNDGAVFAWDARRTPAPRRLALPPAAEIAASATHACARLRDGAVTCWHSAADDGSWRARESHFLGEHTPEVDELGAPVPVADAGPAAQVVVGRGFACARRRDGTAWCWGARFDAYEGPLRDGPPPPPRARPEHVAALDGAARLAASGYAVCALRPDAAARCLGLSSMPALRDVDWLATSRDGQAVCVGTRPGLRRCWDASYTPPLELPRLAGLALDEGACAWDAAGTVYCGEGLGPPQRFEDFCRVRDLPGGSWGACALTLEGAVHCRVRDGEARARRTVPVVLR